jgi:hypothetical protein
MSVLPFRLELADTSKMSVLGAAVAELMREAWVCRGGHPKDLAREALELLFEMETRAWTAEARELVTRAWYVRGGAPRDLCEELEAFIRGEAAQKRTPSEGGTAEGVRQSTDSDQHRFGHDQGRGP